MRNCADLCLLDGFLAGLVQHEIDHLNGVLYIDRAEKNHAAEEEAWWTKVYPRLETQLCTTGTIAHRV